MPNFIGLLSIIGSQSNLSNGPTNSLLLMAGISDPAQATFAATQFLVKTKNLHSGQMINVTGNAGTIGSVNIIAMTNASAAVPSPVGLTASVAVLGGTGNRKQGKKKSVTKKGVKNSAKKALKKGARKAAEKSKKKSGGK